VQRTIGEASVSGLVCFLRQLKLSLIRSASQTLFFKALFWTDVNRR
jgi:hypothetical protein